MTDQRFTAEQVCAIAFTAAGAATYPFMRDHPTYVMPTEDVSLGVVAVLAEQGIDVAKVPGYSGALSGA